MSAPAISISGVCKRYRLGGGTGAAYRTFREAIVDTVSAPMRRFSGRKRQSAPDARTLWALRDVSFDVQPGEVIGIIGRNGAGKSTLLKVLSRITEPTLGRIRVRGRMSSLLEVGTGFHPELSGRENLFLSGAVMGMSRREIISRFDDIVAFAEVDQFIDTPVKRYSSGMYLRLAFAVAAHLEPEILVVDEVLAVGDAIFQKKCLGKMGEVADSGRTVLFVSHNMSAVNRLCSRAVLLEGGSVKLDGSTEEVTSIYLRGAGDGPGSRTWENEAAPGNDQLKMVSVRLVNAQGEPVSVVEVSQDLRLQIRYRVLEPGLSFRCAAMLHTQGVCAFASVEPRETVRDATGEYCSEVTIPAHLLAEGEYTVGVSIFTSQSLKQHFARIVDALAFQVYDAITGDSARGDYVQNLAGVLRPRLEWRIESPAAARELALSAS